MLRVISVVLLAFVGLASLTQPVNAAHRPQKESRTIDWKKRDTAIYVVSTVNLLRTATGRPLSETFASKLDVVRFNVWADTTTQGLFFIQLRRDDGLTAGVLAYQMGWVKPRTITDSFTQLGVAAAPPAVIQAYKSDSKQLIGSFASTMPQQ